MKTVTKQAQTQQSKSLINEWLGCDYLSEDNSKRAGAALVSG